MVELELTVQEEYFSGSADYLRELLKEFETQQRIRVRVRGISWADAWQELVKMAIYHDGPDVSQIGSTWVSSLAGMNALLPFKTQHLRRMGGAEAFLPEFWSTASPPGEKEIFSIPWLAYARLVYYRQDWLEKAGIDAETAFATPMNFQHTLQNLSQAGAPGPWAVPFESSVDTLHNIGSWIWQAGGRFVRQDGKQTMFSQPEALAGMKAYFELFHSMGEQYPTTEDALIGYSQNQVAVTMSGPGTWIYYLANLAKTAPEIAENTRIAIPLNLPFIGSSNLVIWRYTRHPNQAAELVQFLLSRDVQENYPSKIGLLPVRLDVLGGPPFSTDESYQIMTRALHAGRTFPPITLWGLIEERLPPVLAIVGQEVKQNPDRDIADILQERIPPLAQRIERTITQHS